MRILYLNYNPIPCEQANIVHKMKMCEALAQEGHEVYLMRPVPPDSVMDHEEIFRLYGVKPVFTLVDVPYVIFSETYLPRTILLKQVMSLVKRFSPDLVYDRVSWFGLSALSSVVTKVPMILEFHSYRNFMDGGPLKGSIKRWWTRIWLHSPHIRRLVFITRQLADHFMSHFPEASAIDSVIAQDGASLPPDPLPPMKRPWPGRKGALQVGYAGSLYPGKGMENIVLMAENLPQMDFHVAGGPQDLVEEWRSRNIPKNLHLHGMYPPAMVPSFLDMCDVLVAPYSRRVTVRGLQGGKSDIADVMSPLKIFEYMAARKPLVASALPVIEEVLNSDMAYLADPEDTRQWVNLLEHIEQNREEAFQKAKKARAVLEQRYTWRQRARLILSGIQ